MYYRYVPLFEYFIDFSDVAFGTGVVHMAPAFGEDDYRVCTENEIINKVRKSCCISVLLALLLSSWDAFCAIYIKFIIFMHLICVCASLITAFMYTGWPEEIQINKEKKLDTCHLSLFYKLSYLIYYI